MLPLPPPFALRPRAAGWLLVLALLWAQNLGLWHRLVHVAGPVPAASAWQGASDTGSGENDTGAVAATWLEQLFASHQDGRDCLGFDEATLGAALTTGVLALVGLPCSASVQQRAACGAFFATWRLFQARAPPCFR